MSCKNKYECYEFMVNGGCTDCINQYPQFKVEKYNNTWAIIRADEIIDFTTKYDEVESRIISYCDENDLDFGEVEIILP